MCGGLFGYLGYDMVRLMERLPAKNADVLGLPEAVLMRPTLFAVFDTVTDELTLAAPVYPGRRYAPSSLGRGAGTASPTRRRRWPGRCRAPPAGGAAAAGAAVEHAARAVRGDGGADEGVHRRRRHLPGGAVASVSPRRSPAAVRAVPGAAPDQPGAVPVLPGFRRLRVVGSSPEILVRLRDGTVTIRPLAGTRRRGATPDEDAALEAELLADPKERAEHLMLLDLGRNDVGRVAEIGTVKVTESFAIERFSHVMHISSNVEGQLAAGLDAVDALVGGFPAGTLTGAPKIRAMQIIEELEPIRRGIYGGCIGYFAADGTMDTCIGLRTALVKDGVMHVQAGGGVVADSTPEAEYEETRQKARALFRAAEEAVRFAARS